MEFILITAAIFSAYALSAATWRIAKTLAKKENKDELYLAHEYCKTGKRNCLVFTLLMAAAIWLYPTSMGIFGSLAFVSVYNWIQLKRIQPKILTALEIKRQQAAVVMFHMLLPNKEILRISVIETHQAWPPLALELGIGNHCLPAKKAPTNLVNAVNHAIKQGLATTSIQNIKTQLQIAGANHPIDIDGSNTSSTIREFFEKIMLEPQPG